MKRTRSSHWRLALLAMGVLLTGTTGCYPALVRQSQACLADKLCCDKHDSCCPCYWTPVYHPTAWKSLSPDQIGCSRCAGSFVESTEYVSPVIEEAPVQAAPIPLPAPLPAGEAQIARPQVGVQVAAQPAAAQPAAGPAHVEAQRVSHTQPAPVEYEEIELVMPGKAGFGR